MQDFRKELFSPQRIDINLADTALDREISIAGTSFYIYEAPDQTSLISVKINRQGSDSLDFVLYTGFRTPFKKLFITTPAGQTGIIKLVVLASEIGESGFIDNRSSISSVMQEISDQLRGDSIWEMWGDEVAVGTTPAVLLLAANANRKGGSIQSKSTNSGIIYIGFGSDVSSTKWAYELYPGAQVAIEQYRGNLYAIATVADQKAGVVEL
jgi:hypothetical protein